MTTRIIKGRTSDKASAGIEVDAEFGKLDGLLRDSEDIDTAVSGIEDFIMTLSHIENIEARGVDDDFDKSLALPGEKLVAPVVPDMAGPEGASDTDTDTATPADMKGTDQIEAVADVDIDAVDALVETGESLSTPGEAGQSDDLEAQMAALLADEVAETGAQPDQAASPDYTPDIPEEAGEGDAVMGQGEVDVTLTPPPLAEGADEPLDLPSDLHQAREGASGHDLDVSIPDSFDVSSSDEIMRNAKASGMIFSDEPDSAADGGEEPVTEGATWDVIIGDHAEEADEAAGGLNIRKALQEAGDHDEDPDVVSEALAGEPDQGEQDDDPFDFITNLGDPGADAALDDEDETMQEAEGAMPANQDDWQDEVLQDVPADARSDVGADTAGTAADTAADAPDGQSTDEAEVEADDVKKPKRKSTLVLLFATAAVIGVVGFGAYLITPQGNQHPAPGSMISSMPAVNDDAPASPDVDGPQVAMQASPPVSVPDPTDMEDLRSLAQTPQPPAPASVREGDADLAGIAEGRTNTDDINLSDLFLGQDSPESDAAAITVNADELEPTVALSDFETLVRSVAVLDENAQDLLGALQQRDAQISSLEMTLSEVAERAERAETLALAQNQVLVRFVATEEKLEMAEQLIVDLSRRIATVEGIDPADRADMDTRLSDIDQRLRGLQRDVGMVARMTINGSPAAITGPAGGSQANFDRATEPRMQSPVARPENVPHDVSVGDFVNGYGAVLEIFATSDGGRMVVMENGSVLVN